MICKCGNEMEIQWICETCGTRQCADKEIVGLQQAYETQGKKADKLADALMLAEQHLEYCNYGDSWEREVAENQKLPEKIAEALKEYRGE